MDMKKLTIVVVSVFVVAVIGFLAGKSAGRVEAATAATVVSVEKANPWYKPWADDEYVVRKADGTTDKIIIK